MNFMCRNMSLRCFIFALLMIFQNLWSSESFLVTNDPSVKKISEEIFTSKEAEMALEENQARIRYAIFDKDDKLTIKTEIVTKFVNEVGGEMKPNYENRLVLKNVSPRVYLQFCDFRTEDGSGTERYLVGVDDAGKLKWKMRSNGLLPPTSADGIIFKSNKSDEKNVAIFDPDNGKSVIKVDIETKMIHKIYHSFHAYNKDTQCLYVTTGLNDGNAKHNRLIEWNLRTGSEKELAQLNNQMLTGVKPSIDQIVIHKTRNYLLMVMSWNSRINSKPAFVIYDLGQSKFIYKEYVDKWGSPNIVLGNNNQVGVEYENQKGETVLITYELGELKKK